MKKALLIIVPLLLIIGVVLGLGFVGIINIPYVTKKKKPAKATAPVAAAKDTSKHHAASAPVIHPRVVRKVVPKPTPPDEVAGQTKLAKLWDALEPAQLEAIIVYWKDPELAKVLVKMDTDKVAELLAAIDSKRASRLSRAIQEEAARPIPPNATIQG